VSLLRIEVDAEGLLSRHLTDLERTQLPFAAMQAANATAVEIRQTWARTAPRVFYRPTPMTTRAAQYLKATKQKPYAEIFLRDEAFKGTPPAKYLFPQVEGGPRRDKGFENLLQRSGILMADQQAVPGRGAVLDAFGNISGGQLNQILSQLGSRSDLYTNESAVSRKRRHSREARREIRRSDFFAVREKSGHLRPGIWQRDRMRAGKGSGVWLVLAFVKRAAYRPRYDIFGLAQRTWNRIMPFHFARELEKAVQNARLRGRG
jgi:hypothetical protein